MPRGEYRDTEAKERFLRYPTKTELFWREDLDYSWIRAQPKGAFHATTPYLFSAGTDLRNTPDAMYVIAYPKFADVLCFESCSQLENFYSKRSHFMPSTTSTMVRLPVRWLQEEITGRGRGGPMTPRWRVMGTFREEPENDVILPVRKLRAVYALWNDEYDKLKRYPLPYESHEYFMNHENLEWHPNQMQNFLRGIDWDDHWKN